MTPFKAPNTIVCNDPNSNGFQGGPSTWSIGCRETPVSTPDGCIFPQFGQAWHHAVSGNTYHAHAGTLQQQLPKLTTDQNAFTVASMFKFWMKSEVSEQIFVVLPVKQ